jgi:hypothetical protein
VPLGVFPILAGSAPDVVGSTPNITGSAAIDPGSTHDGLEGTPNDFGSTPIDIGFAPNAVGTSQVIGSTPTDIWECFSTRLGVLPMTLVAPPISLGALRTLSEFMELVYVVGTWYRIASVTRLNTRHPTSN